MPLFSMMRLASVALLASSWLFECEEPPRPLVPLTPQQMETAARAHFANAGCTLSLPQGPLTTCGRCEQLETQCPNVAAFQRAGWITITCTDTQPIATFTPLAEAQIAQNPSVSRSPTTMNAGTPQFLGVTGGGMPMAPLWAPTAVVNYSYRCMENVATQGLRAAGLGTDGAYGLPIQHNTSVTVPLQPTQRPPSYAVPANRGYREHSSHPYFR